MSGANSPRGSKWWRKSRKGPAAIPGRTYTCSADLRDALGLSPVHARIKKSRDSPYSLDAGGGCGSRRGFARVPDRRFDGALLLRVPAPVIDGYDPAVGSLDGTGVADVPRGPTVSKHDIFAPGAPVVLADARADRVRFGAKAPGERQAAVLQAHEAGRVAALGA